MPTAEIAPNVVRGAEFLDDAYGPEWDKQINLNNLDLSSTCDCVVGQLMRKDRSVPRFERYWHGLDVLGVTHPYRLGFVRGGQQRWERLTDSWRALILKRREARRR